MQYIEVEDTVGTECEERFKVSPTPSSSPSSHRHRTDTANVNVNVVVVVECAVSGIESVDARRVEAEEARERKNAFVCL